MLLMVPLVRDVLVASVKGRGGGVRLGRPAGQVTLGEIYLADRPAGLRPADRKHRAGHAHGVSAGGFRPGGGARA